MIKVESFFWNDIPTQEICTLEQAQTKYFLDDEWLECADYHMLPEDTLGIVITTWIDTAPDSWSGNFVETTRWYPLTFQGCRLKENKHD